MPPKKVFPTRPAQKWPQGDPEWVGVVGETMSLGWPQTKSDIDNIIDVNADVFSILVAHLSIHREGSLICGSPSGCFFFH